MHPRIQERNFTVRLGQLMSRGADHFMTTREFALFDECLKVSARAVRDGITEAELIELESLVSQTTGKSIQVPAGEVFGVRRKVSEDDVIEAAWPSDD